MRTRFFLPCFCLAAIVMLGILAGGIFFQLHKYRYPYGWSHCCDIQLMFALREYAEEHGGVYPAGEASPEGSLSLLYPKYANANLLRGKTVPLHRVEAALNTGQRLGPENCGWHYVEGLRMDDDPHIAIFWDKAGLGHNGQRLTNGGHVVWFLDTNHEHVPEARWQAFLEEQRQLLARRVELRKSKKR